MWRLLSLALACLFWATYGLATPLADAPPPQPGQLLVKLKPAFAYLNANGQSMRTAAWKQIAPSLSVGTAVPLSTFATTKQGAAARRMPSSGIDLRLYHQLSFDPALPLEMAIAELLKSGMVELAEPVHLAVPYDLPNDPLLSSQHYLDLINASRAWDISTGSRDIIIAIIDTGVDLTHPDLLDNLYRNEADPLDGLDNDGDGFVDNYWGWDFAGSDYEHVMGGDNDPHVDKANMSHGTRVAGSASAVTNNGVGVAGIGYNSKLMALKHTADNDTRYHGSGYLTNLLQGVLYAASQGAHIINASYGTTHYSQIAHDVYRYVAQEHGVLVIAAAGNSNYPGPHYPSDYDYVLSVAASTQADGKAQFSNYSYGVALSAPGEGVLTANVGASYQHSSGTSFAAPLVAGAAALVKSVYPDFSGQQIGEVLRVSADKRIYQNLDETYQHKMGRGRLDVHAALTQKGPSLRAEGVSVSGHQGDIPKAGQQAYVKAMLVNYLWPATNVSVRLSSLDAHVTVVQDQLQLGNMDMLQQASLADAGLLVEIDPNLPPNAEVVLRLDYTADGYEDYQYITVVLNPSFLTLRENKVATTVSGTGRVGYEDSAKTRGIGFEYEEENMLYEMGLMMGTDTERVVSSVRARSGVHEDFAEQERLVRQAPGAIADVEVSGRFADSRAYHTRKLGVEVAYRIYVWRKEPHDRSLLFVYKIYNRNTTPLDNFVVGYFADWDINPDGYKDLAGWDSNTNTGYAYSAPKENRRVAGIQVLNAIPNYWAMDNTSHQEEGNIGVYDGFTEEEKYRTLSSGLGRLSAGHPETGSDISVSVGAGPYTIAPGDSITVAFALHGGNSIEEVLAAASKMQELYDTTAGLRLPMGILANELEGVQLYPNPSRGAVTLSWPEQHQQPYAIKVFDSAGRQVQARQAGQGGGSAGGIQLSMPPQAGLYLLEIRQGQKRATRRLMVH